MFKALFERHPDSGMQSSRADYEVVVKDHDLVDIKTWYFQPVNIVCEYMVDIKTWYFQPVNINIVFESGRH